MSDRKESLFLNAFCLAWGLFLLLIATLVYIADPLCLYRYDPKVPPYWDPRYQVAGFAKTYPYDTIIAGTSITQLFSLKQIAAVLGGKPIKMSFAGSAINIQQIAVKSAINSGQVKTVIWGIDRCYFSYLPNQYPETFPIGMYNNSLIVHWQYMTLCYDNFALVLAPLTLKLINRVPSFSMSDELERYHNWHDDHLFSSELMLKLFCDCFPICPPPLTSNKADYTAGIKNFYSDFLPLIKNNPSVTFIIFFPPYSLVAQKLNNISNSRSRTSDRKFRRIILAELAKLPNVKMFDFETDADIVANLDNYKDHNHYSKHTNAYMIELIAQGKNLVTSENIDRYQRKFDNLPKLHFKQYELAKN
ncbi:MAG: hypothetical protein LBL30_01630 [Holosporales bacterium]|jgi:hypothetical protein|nr:hypothetical protein [Holosporales bacterium]